MTKNTPPGWMQSAQGINLAKQMFAQSITLYLPLGAFVGAIGVISADRQQGYFRFLFSKPVNVLAYYAQTYVAARDRVRATFGLIVWGFGAYTVHFSVHRSMEAAALTFVLIGGLGLLLGALTRYDGARLIAIYVLALMLQQLIAAPNGLKNGGLPDWLATFAKGLPPVAQARPSARPSVRGHGDRHAAAVARARLRRRRGAARILFAAAPAARAMNAPRSLFARRRV